MQNQSSIKVIFYIFSVFVFNLQLNCLFLILLLKVKKSS